MIEKNKIFNIFYQGFSMLIVNDQGQLQDSLCELSDFKPRPGKKFTQIKRVKSVFVFKSRFC